MRNTLGGLEAYPPHQAQARTSPAGVLTPASAAMWTSSRTLPGSASAWLVVHHGGQSGAFHFDAPGQPGG